MTALIVIDMQIFFAAPGAKVLATTNALIDHFHTAAEQDPDSAVVVYTQHGHPPEQFDGTEVSQLVRFWGSDKLIHRFAPNWELLPALRQPVEAHIRVQDKDTYDSFLHTNLEEMLRARGVKRVVVCGVLTNFCCETV
jgi:nicotinamidase-related amidase